MGHLWLVYAQLKRGLQFLINIAKPKLRQEHWYTRRGDGALFCQFQPCICARSDAQQRRGHSPCSQAGHPGAY